MDFLLIGILFLPIILSQYVLQSQLGESVSKSCEREEYKVIGGKIQWPHFRLAYNEEIAFVVSEPPCFAKNSLVTRNCTKGGWQPFTTECSIFLTKTHNVDDYTIKISDTETEWNDKYCYGSDKTIFNLKSDERRLFFKYLFAKYNITKFWLPSRRFSDDVKFSPVVWKLPGRYWNSNLRQSYDELSKNKCALAKITDVEQSGLQQLSIEMTNCKQKHFNLCVYKKQFINRNWCPKLSYTSYMGEPTHCYYLSTEMPNIQLAWDVYLRDKEFLIYLLDKLKIKKLYLKEFNQQHQIVLYKSGLVKVERSEAHNYYLNRFAIQAKNAAVKMHLDFNPNDETLQLIVYNRFNLFAENEDEYGIKCFTNSDYELIREVKIKDLIWEDAAKSLFELKLYGRGIYWCEGHSIANYELIRSQQVLAWKERQGFEYALFTQLPCNSINCKQINQNVKLYAKLIEKILNDLRNFRNIKSIDIEDVIIVNIESIDDEIKMICHLTVTFKPHRDDSEDSSSESSEEDEDDDDEDFLNTKHMALALEELKKLIINSSYFNGDVNSTEYCLPNLKKTSEDNIWKPTRIGMMTTRKDLCLMSNGLPAPRKCLGDFIYGAAWDNISDQLNCFQPMSLDLITNKLFDMGKSKQTKADPSKVLQDINELITQNTELKIIPADIFYLGQIFQKIKKLTQTYLTTLMSNQTIDLMNQTSNTTAAVERIQTDDIASIYNHLMKLNMQILKISTKLNSTNALLEAFENIVDIISSVRITNSSISNFANQKSITSVEGVFTQINENLMIFSIDLLKSNITGVLILQSRECEENFLKCQYKFLSKYQNSIEILNEENIELGAYVPEILLDSLGEIDYMANKSSDLINPTIILKIFRNDHLFVESNDIVNMKPFSKVISISIPGYDHNLPELLPIFLRTEKLSPNASLNSCRYWNYETWIEDGIEFLAASNLSDNVILCGCSHLTPFAYLVGGYYNLSVSSDNVVIIRQIHHDALDIITLLGCSLSLIGVFGIFLTAIVFQAWRERASTKILLQLSLAIALQMIIFCFVNTEVLAAHLIESDNFFSCILLGSCMHYFVLVQFSWMLIIAYLQYKRYVQVLGSRPTRFFAKSFVLGWGVPLIPVILVLLVDRDSYIPEEYDNTKICYPSGLSLYYGVLLPIATIIILNLIIFIAVIYNILKGPDASIRHTTSEKQLALSQFRLLVLLFFLLGLTWIFGFFSAIKAGIVFSYLFCFTATVQGFVLFIYFVILDPTTRNLWTSYLRGDKKVTNTTGKTIKY